MRMMLQLQLRGMYLRRYFSSKLMDKKGITAAKLEQYSRFTPSPISLNHFLEYGRISSAETSYLFMRKEIPVRLANIMKELELLPDELQSQSPCSLVQDYYNLSFQEMIAFESAPNNSQTRVAFTDALNTIRQRHVDVVPTMAEALMQMKIQHFDPDDHYHYLSHHGLEQQIEYFLDRLYMSRISIHMLIGQHVMLFGDGSSVGVSETGNDGIVGYIDPMCDVVSIARTAFANAAFLCDQNYMMSSNLKINVVNCCSNDQSTPVSFVYVPAHLNHILFELFKNALRATVERHEDAPSLPDVKMLVVKSPNDVSIKISDQGGGIPRAESDKTFKYMYTTASTVTSSMGSTPMAGLGYGLPISRLYARYFRGDIVLYSIDGFGTDVVVYLRALSRDASEFLPVYNTMTRQRYKTSWSTISDWTDPIANFGRFISSKPRIQDDSVSTTHLHAHVDG